MLPPHALLQSELVASAREGDCEALARGLMQSDPPLDVDEANAHGLTALFAAFKMLLEVGD